MAKQTTTTATAVSKSKPKVPVKKKKSGGSGAAAANAPSSKSNKTTAVATAKVKSKSRTGTVAVVKRKSPAVKKKTESSSNGSSSNSKTKARTTTATVATTKQSSVFKSTTSGRTTSNSTSKSNSIATNSNGVNASSTGRREISKNLEERLPKTPVDRSTVNFPYDVRINGISSMISTIQKSTPKVKKLLQDECDIILECRYCKNLFRSMPNFLCHKQIYCKNMVDSSPDTSSVQHLLHRSVPRVFEYNIDMSAISSADNQPTSSLSSSNSHPVFGQNTCSLVETENNKTRSTSTFLSQIDQSSSSDTNTKCAEDDDSVANQKVRLVVEPVQNRKDGVVFQRRVDYTEPECIDIAACDSSASISDIREVVDRDTAILGPDGKVMCTGTSRGIEKIIKHLTAQIEITQKKMVRNSTNTNGFPGTCDICKTVFTTEKAYRQHKRDAPDCGGQSSSSNYRSPSKADEPSNSVNGDSSYEELREDQSRKAFVKKLFAPQSPFKSSSEITEILHSPLKSPLFAKKLLQCSSPRTSPYKKVLSKAVKQIRQPETPSPSRLVSPECSPLKSISSFKPLPFFCIRCSRGFKTTHEMSVHIARCNGRSNFNESVIDAQGNAGQRKIGIQIRRNYFKTSSVPLNEHDYACSSERRQRTHVPDSSVDGNLDILTTENKETAGLKTLDLCLLGTNDLAKNLEVGDETGNLVETMDYSPTLSNDKGKENDSSQRTSKVEKNNNNGSSSSESEGDRESISNKTDSGISFSSTTATSDDQEESRSTDLEILENSISGKSKNEKAVDLNGPDLQAVAVIPSFKRKRKSSVEKVFRSNSTTVSLKRKSHRIRSKSKTLIDDESSELEETKKN